MPKLRKQRRRKTFKHNVNRKRLRNKLSSVGNIECAEIKNAWHEKHSLQTNLNQMGLSYDPNKTIKINHKSKAKLSKKSNQDDWDEDTIESSIEPARDKLHVVNALEADAKAPREKLFRLPNGQIEWLTYLILKYKLDYKAMAKDNKNYYQETWKQIRAKIRRFMRIPEQYNKFLLENELEGAAFEEPQYSDDEV